MNGNADGGEKAGNRKSGTQTRLKEVDRIQEGRWALLTGGKGTFSVVLWDPGEDKKGYSHGGISVARHKS